MSKLHRLAGSTGIATANIAVLMTMLALPADVSAQAQTAAPGAANNTSNLPPPTATGSDTVATGYGSAGVGNRSTADGEGASAQGTGSVAIGHLSFANGVVNQAPAGYVLGDVVSGTTAVGEVSRANGNGSTAVGQGALADGAVTGDNSQSVVFGATTAVGQAAAALGQNSTALGQGAVAYGNLNVFGNIQTGYTTALGQGAQAMGSSATAVGQGANAASDLDTAIGQASTASGVSGTVVGQAASVSDYGAALGNFATAGTLASALGYQAHAQTYSTAVGTLTTVQGYYSVGLGYSATVPSNFSVAIGQRAVSSADNGLALGSYASTSGDHSVALGADSHDQGFADVVALGNPELTRRIIDLAPGINGTDAVNINQLQGAQSDTSNGLGLLAATTAANFGGGSAVGATPYSGITAPSYLIQGNTYHDVGSALHGIDTTLTSLAASQGGGAASANSNPVQYSTAAAPTTANPGVPSSDATLVGAAGAAVALHNLAAGALTSASTDAVNGAQLFATNAQVANNTMAVANLANQVSNGATGPVQYANPATPTTPNGGVRTNDLTLVGATVATVGLHNVANGAIAAGSTDAVNGGQIFALSLTATNAVSYDTGPNGARQNSVTLAGGNAAAPVAIRNVAPANVAVGSTDAVNGGQLYATNQAVGAAQGTATTALAVANNSVQYGPGRTAVTFNGGGASTVLSNVAAGTVSTDAVNVAQLSAGMGSTLSAANAYTDGRLTALNFDVRNVQRQGFAGTSAAMAAAGLPQPYDPGKGMIAFGGGTYGGQSAFAIGVAKAFNDGHTVMRLSGSYDSQGRVGASGGVGYQF